MLTGRGISKLLVEMILISMMLAYPSWLVFSQSCSCADLDDIICFANAQVEAAKVYMAARDNYADQDRQNRRSGEPPDPYDDPNYRKVSADSGKAMSCPQGCKVIGASTQGTLCTVSYQWRNCPAGEVHDGVPNECMKSLVDAHENVHVNECWLGKEYSNALISNYKTRLTMTMAMDEEVKAHRAGWKNAVDTYNAILKEWCCDAQPPYKYSDKGGAATKPTLSSILKNLLK